MSISNSCNGVIIVDPDGVNEKIVELTGFTLDETTDTVELPIMDGTCSSDVEAGSKKWAGSIDILYDPDDAGGELLGNGDAVMVDFRPVGEAIGALSIKGTILITGVSMPVEVDSLITKSITYEGKGAFVKSIL